MNRTPNILVLTFRPKMSQNHGVESLKRSLAPHAKLCSLSIVDQYHVMPAPEETLRFIDGLFILGASDLFFDGERDSQDPAKEQTIAVVDALRPLVAHIITNNVPTFAFCFGHQLIAHSMGSEITASSETGKVGTYEVSLTEEGVQDPLFASFPHTFLAHYGHRDVVATRPKESTLLAFGDRCHNAMLRYGSHIYTSQFHPELPSHVMHGYLSNHDAYADIAITRTSFTETPDAETLPVRFVQRITVRT